MKKFMAIAACLAAVLMLNACVTVEKTEESQAAAQAVSGGYNFIQMHNDALSLFNGYDMYAFVTGLDISGNADEKMIYVTAVVPADLNEEVMDIFAAATLRRINDAAMYQNRKINESTALDMGDYWKEYGCEISMYAANDDGTQGDLIKTYSFKAGEDIGLSPDTETYEAEWLRQLEILERNSQ